MNDIEFTHPTKVGAWNTVEQLRDNVASILEAVSNEDIPEEFQQKMFYKLYKEFFENVSKVKIEPVLRGGGRLAINYPEEI